MGRTTIFSYPLHTVFEIMESGKLVVPSFQRRYVWKRSMVKKLLQSIYKGYPIGNITVLEGEPDLMDPMPAEESLFPSPSSNMHFFSGYTWYVLDGAQRMAALYNVFRGANTAFRFWFDLEREVLLEKAAGAQPHEVVSLNSLLTTDKFRLAQIEIARRDDARRLFERLDALHSAFMNYELFFQVLVDMSIDDAFNIAEYINTSGVRLTKAELERARRKL
jgi:uncharacterized protein with ParB-like and HNH nuclease domain